MSRLTLILNLFGENGCFSLVLKAKPPHPIFCHKHYIDSPRSAPTWYICSLSWVSDTKIWCLETQTWPGYPKNLVLSEVVHINKLIVPVVAGRTMMHYLCVNSCSTCRVSGYGRCAGTECDDMKGVRRHYSVRWDVIGKWPHLLLFIFFFSLKNLNRLMAHWNQI